MNFDPASVDDPRIRRAYAYWDGLRAGLAIPGRADIDPERIKEILPHVLLVDVLADPLDFRFRLAGTDVVERYGQELTGRRLSEIDVDGKYDQIFAEYRLTVDRRQPQLFQEEFRQNTGRHVSYRRLLCPLSADGGRVDMLFGVQVSTIEGEGPPPTGIRRI